MLNLERVIVETLPRAQVYRCGRCGRLLPRLRWTPCPCQTDTAGLWRGIRWGLPLSLALWVGLVLGATWWGWL